MLWIYNWKKRILKQSYISRRGIVCCMQYYTKCFECYSMLFTVNVLTTYHENEIHPVNFPCNVEWCPLNSLYLRVLYACMLQLITTGHFRVAFDLSTSLDWDTAIYLLYWKKNYSLKSSFCIAITQSIFLNVFTKNFFHIIVAVPNQCCLRKSAFKYNMNTLKKLPTPKTLYVLSPPLLSSCDASLNSPS